MQLGWCDCVACVQCEEGEEAGGPLPLFILVAFALCCCLELFPLCHATLLGSQLIMDEISRNLKLNTPSLL